MKAWLYKNAVGCDWFSGEVHEPVGLERGETEKRKRGHRSNTGKSKRDVGKGKHWKQGRNEEHRRRRAAWARETKRREEEYVK